MKGWTKIFVVLGVVFVLLLVFAARWMAGDRMQHITVGADTTGITGPLMADGRVDYFAAINEKYGAGMTAENNAGILIAELVPTDAMLPAAREAIGVKAGVPPMFEDYVKFEERRTGKKFDSTEMGKISDQLDELAKGPWKKGDQAEVQAWLEEEEPVGEKLDMASRRPRLFMPLVRKDPTDTLMTASISMPLGRVRGMSQMLTIRAMEKIGEGDIQSAWEDTMTMQRMGRLVCQGQTLIHYLVGLSIVSQADRVEGVILDKGMVTKEDATKWQKELDEVGASPSIVGAIDCGERWVKLDYIILWATYGPDVFGGGTALPPRANSFSFGILPVNFNSMLRTMNHLADERTAAILMPRFADREAKMAGYLKDVKAFVDAHGGASGPSVIGRVVGLLMDNDLSQALRLRDAADQEGLLVRDGLRGVIYFAEHGRAVAAQRDFAGMLTPTIVEEKPPELVFLSEGMVLACNGPVKVGESKWWGWRRHFEVHVGLR